MAIAGFARVTPAAEPGRVFAEGDWSKAVADDDGNALRGRLVLCERPVTRGGQVRREVSVYVELQDARDSVGPAMRVFCDFGRSDFRAEYKAGLHCEMTDGEKRPVPTDRGGFGGGMPASEWVTLPAGATIRLRASPFGVHRENAMAIMPTPDKLWVIADNDTKEYFLGGTFTAEPKENNAWHGTLELPALRVAGPAAVDPVAALVARLAATHGLWLNGMFPKLDTPPDAPAEDVVAEVFKMTTPDEGRVTEHQIVETRQVTIPILTDRSPGPGEMYTAVRVKTNVGPKIVLIQRSSSGWWSRVYDGK
jgi:hypothetical protein